MITHSDEGPDHDPDDPLTVILRPPAEHLGAPPGHYEAIRRGASRRRMLRAAAGAALTCGVAALVVLPLRLTASDAPGSPTVPLAPLPASSPSTLPPRPAKPVPSSAGPGRSSRSAPPTSAPTAGPTRGPNAAEPSGSTAATVAPIPTRAASIQPSAPGSRAVATPSSAPRH
ncbi:MULTISPECIES: hypothetical protein [unclassified Streptomyces]|uniref:hypothetical protein n=1 Tax=unclassified Streptomyces TaxID=2593676 RepID=UPI0022545BF0|nr:MULTISPECIES: hypothetical protein [unclassified Streptomyces]MCX5292662.1 hypothetical protein [Streptomyces sp. NBC_00183]